MRFFHSVLPAFFLSLTIVSAQQPSITPPIELPPLMIPTESNLTLPNGTPVSQPLRSTELPVNPPPTIQEIQAEQAQPKIVSHGLPEKWQRYDYLMWWTQGQSIPTLLTTQPGPEATTLLGGRNTPAQGASGGRFTFGRSFDSAQNTGAEISYLFLGTQTTRSGFARFDSSNLEQYGRPYQNRSSGLEEFFLVAGPQTTGQLETFLSTRVSGWQATGFLNIAHSEDWHLNGLAGYRYFMVNEGLRLVQHSFGQSSGDNPMPLSLEIADQFDAHTRFHGGEVGLRGDWQRGRWSIELDARIALGKSVLVVRRSGTTVTRAGAGQNIAQEVYRSGFFGQPSNTGRMEESVLAYLPEGNLRFSYQVNSSMSFVIGYSMIYLSEAVRPAQQIDRVFENGPLRTTLGSRVGDRPFGQLLRDDLWVQGLTIGLHWSY